MGLLSRDILAIDTDSGICSGQRSSKERECYIGIGYLIEKENAKTSQEKYREQRKEIIQNICLELDNPHKKSTDTEVEDPK